MRKASALNLSKGIAAALSAALLVMALALAGCASGTDQQASSASSSSAASSAAEQAAGIQASVSILTDDQGQDLSQANTTFVPVENRQVELPEGATAFDALMQTGADIVSEESEYGVYVTSIDGLANGSEGATSGWTYSVNGEMPTESAGAFELSDGDSVVWTFVTSFE